MPNTTDPLAASSTQPTPKPQTQPKPKVSAPMTRDLPPTVAEAATPVFPEFEKLEEFNPERHVNPMTFNATKMNRIVAACVQQIQAQTRAITQLQTRLAAVEEKLQD